MKIKPSLLTNSRKLRKDLTPWEAKLWYHLRAKNFQGFRFRRQFVIGPYIVDFCCHAKKLIIELDGGQHNQKIQKANDFIRAEFLKDQGFKIVRFWNNEIDQNLEGVLETILKELNHLSPNPSPARRGEF